MKEISHLPSGSSDDPSILFAQAIGRRKFSAGAFGQVNANGDYYARYFGTHAYSDIIPNAPKTNAESLSDGASLTKILITFLVLWVVTNKLIRLDTDMTSFFPGLKVVGSVRPTVLHFLTYRAKTHLEKILKFPYAEFCSAKLRAKLFMSKIEVCDFHYGNQVSIMLGMMLKFLTGKNLDVLADEVLFKPLGMKSATFHPPIGDISKVVATENGLCGVVHDEITRKLGFSSGAQGAAGAFFTCEDLLRLMLLPLNEGVANGVQIIGPELINQLGNNQVSGSVRFGLGFGLFEQFEKGYDLMPEVRSRLDRDYFKGAYFKSGFTGCKILVLPKPGIACVIQTNRIHNVRPVDSVHINRFYYCADMQMLTGELPRDAFKL